MNKASSDHALKRLEKSQLQAIINQLKFKITRIEKEIFEMKESEAYETIIDIEDWDQYFANTKEQLIEKSIGLSKTE